MKHIALAASLVLLTGAAAPADSLRLVMVDVEGGGATLMVTPEGKSVLFDTGWPQGPGGPNTPAGDRPSPESSAQRIAAAAKKLGVSQLDYLVVTHYHTDHAGGVPEVLALLPAATVIDHGANTEPLPAGADPNAPQTANHSSTLYKRYRAAAAPAQHRQVKAGDRIQIGSLTLDIVASDAKVIDKPLAPAAATPGCDTMQDVDRIGGPENPASVGVVATYGKARILHLADATWNVEKALVCPINKLGKIDVMIVSHHGSELSNSPELLAAAAPRIALVGNGPRKGGDKRVFETLAAAPSRPVIWQQHAATRSPEVDRPDNYVVNANTPQDAGYSIEAFIGRDGSVQITNPRNGFSEDYPAPSK